ncbi:hypothetical protein ETB97_007317 [Aspergillus alliaceus]|uniref:Major facilitator superfamily (MFS) profile domain-containing protein n=1 Tax=Petromyces alliaceus TaxID=209559 RepID=A0A8H6E1U7_PETAA|nr:hypothetical protein ETB97_007317 [Aspergillus burnettii]
MAYFGPQFFSLLVGNNNSLTFLLTRIFGAPKVTSYLAFIIWIAERFLRRPLFIFGVLSMSLCMLSTSFVRQIIAYNLSWCSLPWPCTAELFNTRIREPGVALGVAAQWLANFIWAASTPYILPGIGWATFLLFGVLDLLITGFCLPETAGESLKEIDALFERSSVGVDGEEAESCLSAKVSEGIYHHHCRQYYPELELELELELEVEVKVEIRD